MASKASKVEKSAPVYRSTDAIRKAFGRLSSSVNEDVRDVIRGTIAYMDAHNMTVAAMQKELKECKSGVLTVGHVAYFGVAERIYRDAEGTDKGDPREVIKMANRMQVVYGKDGALDRIAELVAANVAFQEWSKGEDANGKRYVPTIAEHKAAKATESGKDGNGNEDGKDDAPTSTTTAQVKSLDDVVLLALTILGRHKDWRTTSQPDAVAELVAILSGVAESK